MTKTTDNLKAAFAGESQANRKYLAFAKKAEEEGYSHVAKLFRAAAHAETVHAHNHLDALDGVGSTMDNLKEAIEGESYEHTRMYPDFIEQAKKDDNPKALQSFNSANLVEKIHENLYKKAMKRVSEREDFEDEEIYVCEVCGNTVERIAPDMCPICSAPKSKFTKIE